MSELKAYGWGRVVKDPKVDAVGETKVANVTMVNNEYVGKDRKELATFITLEFWDSAASFIEENCRKGDIISFDGVIRQETWEKNGEMRSKHFIRVQKFSLNQQDYTPKE